LGICRVQQELSCEGEYCRGIRRGILPGCLLTERALELGR